MLLVAPGPGAPWAAEPRHAIAMHGAPALGPEFRHHPYVNPDAPKGGRLTYGFVGSFDSLNPLIDRGLPVSQIRGTVIESLMARGYDEPFTLYGLIARTVETDAARSYVTFSIDPAARFSDGRPITAEDVVFSWRLLRDKGRQNHRIYYAKVKRAEILDAHRVRFDLTGSEDRELPLILGLMPVLAKHATDPASFEQTSFTAPLGSGPYRVAEVRPGESVLLRRNPDYWARDRAVTRGTWNFDEIRYDFYRDDNAQFEAFKKGLFDLRPETDPSRWETGYDFPARRDGRVVKDAFPNHEPRGMTALVFNTRRPLFADVRVREAINLLFDFEWVNHNFFFDRYRRTGSYFEGSELSARGRAADARERALLAPFPGAVRADVLAGTWAPPVNDGSGRDRETLRQALALLSAAGYELDRGEMRHRGTGQPFAFEIMVKTRQEERLALSFARHLRRAGIAATTRFVEATQYERRRQSFDFDMMQYYWGQSLSPGNEQAFYWSTAAADEPGTRNYMGAKVPAIDAAIAAIVKAESREELVAAVRVLDRLLISGFYVVPLFHLPEEWLARWAHIQHPAVTPLTGYRPETWWRHPQTQ
ncbi:MAG: extracellular solute-binding protein [Xanthobacteraceae bacterium]|nr:extracellular solute-binding protein [Xanthobacteraceae bacterium]